MEPSWLALEATGPSKDSFYPCDRCREPEWDIHSAVEAVCTEQRHRSQKGLKKTDEKEDHNPENASSKRTLHRSALMGQ